MRALLLAAVLIFAGDPAFALKQAGAPVPPQKAGRQGRLPSAEPLDINRATLEQLKALPGFGYAYARRVIDGRPYLAKSQLLTHGILPPDAYNKISPLIVAHHLQPK